MVSIFSQEKNNGESSLINRNSVLKYWELYLLLAPGLFLLILFKYVPLYGIIMAFKDFNIMKGIVDSPWVGIRNFIDLFSTEKFPQVIMNTVLISFYKIIFRTPAGVILALLLNEIRNSHFKKTIQTVTYLPHFVSWVVVAGIFFDLLSPNGGLVNIIIEALGGKPIFFMADNRFFRSILVFTEIWKETGWNAIIYLAAIAGIDVQTYEAAVIDGAGRLKQVLYITLPGIKSTIVLVLILRLGYILDVGNDQVLMMLKPVVYGVGDVITTYVYRVGLQGMEFSLTTAAGLFKSVIGFAFIYMANTFAKRYSNSSIW